MNFIIQTMLMFALVSNFFRTELWAKSEESASLIAVQSLNSPVMVPQNKTADFSLEKHNKLDVKEVFYQIKNAGKIFDKPSEWKKINLFNDSKGKRLKINIEGLPVGFYQLFVKVVDQKGKGHFLKTKYKDHAMFVIDSSLEVPMPDPKKNNATIAGIDSDNDGIRDDVQRWINTNLGNLPSQLKLAFKQYAIAFQISLLTSNNKQTSILASHDGLRAQDCLYSQSILHGLNLKDVELNREKIKLMYLNTKERIESELKSDENFHGQEVRNLSIEKACNY